MVYETISTKNLVKKFIESATNPSDLGFGRIKWRNRAGYETAMILVDDMDINYFNHIIFKEITQLDFWNDWEGLFANHYVHSNVIDARKTNWGIPSSAQLRIKERWDPDFKEKTWYGICVGDFVLEKDGTLSTVTGFNGTWKDIDDRVHGHDEIHFYDPFVK